MAEKFIQKAIKKPGALRATAKRMGLIKGDQKLSASDIEFLIRVAKRRRDTKLLRRALLARTLRKLARR